MVERWHWSLARRVGFRFVFAYVALYLFPFPLELIPGAGPLGDAWRGLVQTLVIALARPLLGLDITVLPGASSDTTYSYVELLFFILCAALVALVWSLFDRRRAIHDTLWEALHVYVRYALALQMLTYGFIKVLCLQFPSPSPLRLTDTFGDLSPMGLLWSFMGASPAYQVAAGVSEVVGGALVLFRRTSTLGALLLIGVMGHVVLLNFCYDVSAKLPATHLWLMAFLVAAPDMGRLANLLLLQRPTTPREAPPLRTTSWAYRALKVAVVGLMLTSVAQSAIGDINALASTSDPLDGVWEPVWSPAAPPAWRRVAITRYGLTTIATDGERQRFKLVSQDQKTLSLVQRDDPAAFVVTLSYTLRGENDLRLTGVMAGSPFDVALRRIDTSNTPLLTRGFHWVNETPFNR